MSVNKAAAMMLMASGASFAGPSNPPPTGSAFTTSDGHWNANEFRALPADITNISMKIAETYIGITPERLASAPIQNFSTTSVGSWSPTSSVRPIADRISLGSLSGKNCLLHEVVPSDTAHDTRMTVPEDPNNFDRGTGLPVQIDLTGLDGIWTRLHVFLTADRNVDENGKLFSTLIGCGNAGNGVKRFTSTEAFGSKVTRGIGLYMMAPTLGGSPPFRSSIASFCNHYTNLGNSRENNFGVNADVEVRPTLDKGRWLVYDSFWYKNSDNTADGGWEVRLDGVTVSEQQGVLFGETPDTDFQAVACENRLMIGGSPTGAAARPLSPFTEGLGGLFIATFNRV